MIILQHHIIATQYPVATGITIEAGMLVSFDTDGNIVRNNRDAADVSANPVGFSGDKIRSAEAYEFVNKLSEAGNETAGSGKITVYTGPGTEFYLDVDDDAITTPLGTSVAGVVNDTDTNLVAGAYLYPSVSSADDDGKINTTQTGGDAAVAQVVEAASELDSGIPGEFEPGASFQLVDDTVNRLWVKVKSLL